MKKTSRKKKVRRKYRTKPGMAPGLLDIQIPELDSSLKASLINYSEREYELSELQPLSEFRSKLKATKDTKSWLIIQGGLQNQSTLSELLLELNVNPLVLEDVIDSTQRPKLDDYDEYLLVVCKLTTIDEKTGELLISHQTHLLFENLLVSFEGEASSVFTPVISRMAQGKGKLRKLGTDYLLFAILDCLVDHYILTAETLTEQVENLEELLVLHSERSSLSELHIVKKEIIHFRKTATLLRDLTSNLVKSESSLIKDNTEFFFRDLNDHANQVKDSTDNLRDLAKGLVDTYLSYSSHRLNEVMKVLTIIASLFIPLTFIAGVYGMNFKYMPELESPIAYPVVLLIMFVLACIMLLVFKRKRWI